MKIRVIIAGDRNFNDFELLRARLDFYMQHIDMNHVEFVSGTARGADKLGEIYAQQRQRPVKRFPANWALLGGHAGPARNQQMAEYATHLIAFKKPNSRGTADMIRRAKKHGLKVRIVNI